jgi:RHS repeat-associated protein
LRLTRVDVTYAAALVRRYNVSYESALSNTSKSRVQSIQECADAAGTDCLSATTFTYQNGVAGVTAEVSSGVSLPASANLPIDVNGDGRTDVVYSSSATSGSGTWMVMFANTGGGFNAPINSGITNTNFTQAIPIDYNADGWQDFLVPYSGGTWWVVQGTSTGLASPINTGITATGAGGNARTMDINGDGLDDLVFAIVTGSSHSVQGRLRVAGGTFAAATYLYGPVSSPYAIVGPVFGVSEFSGRKRNPDVNGDGRADFLVHATEYDPGIGYLHSWEIVLGGSAGVLFLGNFQMGGGPYWPDLNGDGCSDAVYTWNNYWRYRFSTCTTLGPEYMGPSVGALPQTHAVVVDWDADGLDDIVGVNQSTWAVQYMRSSGEALAAPVDGGVTNSSIALNAGDVNGDGLGDLLYRTSSNVWAYKPHAGVAPDLLDVVTDGFGVANNFDYSVLTDPALYTKGTGAVYPESDVQPTLWAVKRLTATDRSGEGSTYTLDYTYEGARRHLQGRGLLGFARRITTDSRVGYNLKTEEVFLQSFPYTGLPASTTLKQSTGTKIREVTNSWAQLSWPAPEPRAYPYVSTSVARDYEISGASNGTQYRSMTTSITAISSTSGLVTDATTTTTEVATGVNAGAVRTERTWHSSVLDDTANWCLGRAQTTQLIAGHTLTGGSTVTRTTQQTWDGLYCRSTQVVEEPGSSTLQVTTDLGYDAVGHVNSQSVTGIGLAARTTSLTWSANGLYVASLTNPLGQVSTQSWNASLGLPASVTDPNGLTTGWAYDAFGRRTGENRPDLTSTAWVYAPCSSCGARVRYTVQAQSKTTAGSVIRSDEFHFDAFDQQVTRLTPQAAGGSSQVSVERDARGRITRAYVPYWVGGASNGYTDTAFDLLDRVTGTASYTSSGALYSQSSTAYSGLAVTQTDPLNHSTTQVALAWGAPSRVTDAAGGSINYQSNAFGQLTQMTDAYGTTVMQGVYDTRGRPTSVTNVNRGTTTIVPNALGEVASETDAKGQTRSYLYDQLGRLTSRTEPEGTSSWSWGTTADNTASAKYVGGLKSLSGPGYAESYVNDAYGRAATQTVSSDASYQIDYGYNALGTLDTLTYPSSTAGYRLKLQYDYTNGILTAIKDFNAPTTVIWALTTTDARGDVLDETLGANLKVISGRNPLTGLLEYRQAGLGGGTALQNLAYSWDASGNLTQRGDANQVGSCSVGGMAGKLCESFTYDALDRLDTVSRNGTQTLNVDYDLTGNLTARSDVGSYSYHATRKHALVAAGSYSYAYDANGNVTTRNVTTLNWASYDLPLSLNAGANQAQFAYAPDRSRWRQVATTAGVTATTIYVAGMLEKVSQPGVTLWKHLVSTPSGLGAVYIRRSDGTADTYYVMSDHLGSTDKILKAAGSTVQVAESFAAYGARRGSAWTGAPSAADLIAIGTTTPEGFTGHEMLDGVGLIHMNGRVYDPAVGRFLSVDPLVRDLGASQSWNGYGYVEGHVLSSTDPSGWTEDDAVSNKHYVPNDWFSERMLSHDSYHSIGGYWIGDNTPTSALGIHINEDHLEEFGLSAHRPIWVSTGINFGMMPPSGAGLGTGTNELPSRTVNEEGQAQGQEEDSADPICNAPGQGGGGLTLRQRAESARLQGLSGVVGGALLGRVSGAVLGYSAAIGYNAYNLRAGGAWVQGGSAQGNRAYGAAAQGLGIPLSAAQMFAGLYEQYGPSSGGGYRPENGTFLGGPPYGDDPGAQQAIAEGYACGQ